MTNQSNDGGHREGSDRAATTITTRRIKLTRRITCTLDDDTLSKARELGGGNLSRGIRRAVAKAIKDKNPTQE